MVVEVLRFEQELHRAEKIPARRLVATLILSNKLIDKQQLKAIWEEIRMFDIFEIAKEEGLKEGLKEGKTLGILEATREMVVEVLLDRFKIVSASLSASIRALQNVGVLKGLYRQAVTCQSLQEFEALVQQVR